MNRTLKAFAVVAASAVAVCTHNHVAQAQGPAACYNQGHMMAALNHLRNARSWLARSEHNKGGWRENAIRSTDAALHETERGCAFADTH